MPKKPGITITGADAQVDRLQRIADAANASVMKKTMFFVRRLIVKRTEQGEFLNKSKPKYSTAGALYRLNSGALKKAYRKKLGGGYGGGMKKGDSGARWIFLERGYEQYRQIHGRQISHVDLNYDGDMVASMNDITAKKGYGSLGFLQKDEQRKARWLSEMGAGKNKVKYEFFGLSPKEKDRVGRVFEDAWTEQLKAMDVI